MRDLFAVQRPVIWDQIWSRHTIVLNAWVWSRHQPKLIPGLLAVDRLLSPGAPVNNCRWASIQWTWDQKVIMKRIKHNDLTHYFLRDHCTLPASYLASCKKFFKSIKPQASSSKPQASSLTRKDSRIIKDI